MKKTLFIFLCLLFCSGCVERRLTISSQPEGALLTLNDEQIGETPVTVKFNWYGDYKVKLEKQGYETLDTHRKLKAPLHDKFPFDFFAQILNPEKIVDSYSWEFGLEKRSDPNTAKLLKDAENFKKQLTDLK